MIIGERLRTVRLARNLSQRDIEKRTGLSRCYISRVENGHTVPLIETLEKMARALEVPLYQLLYEVDERPLQPLNTPREMKVDDSLWGNAGKSARILALFRRYLRRLADGDRLLLLHLAQEMEARGSRVAAKRGGNGPSQSQS